MKCKFLKKSGLTSPKKMVKGHAAPSDLLIVDNQDGTFTIMGVDASGAQLDISAVATITVSSDTPAVMSVDPPIGMTDAVHALTAGSANLTIVATWTDGSVGPFTVTVPVTVTAGPVTGLVVTWGTPTVRP